MSSLAAALAMLPASAHGASSCNQAATSIATGAGQCAAQSVGTVAQAAVATGGGNGQVQVSRESSTTTQTAVSEAEAKQDVTNANLPVNLATHDPVATNGNHGAGRDASNSAESSAGNEAQTSQGNRQRQEGGSSSCLLGGGGNCQAQLSFQESTTTQKAESEARAKQTVTRLSQRVNAASGGSITAHKHNGPEREASNDATSRANNNASTEQSNNQSQDGGSSGCSHGCGGNGQVQVSEESSTTTQTAVSEAEATQDVTNANLPVNLATPDPVATNGNNSPGRDASNSAESSARNEAQTSQSNRQRQEGGSSSCLLGCGGNGQTQLSFQESTTAQRAESEARAEQTVTSLSQQVNVASGGSITDHKNNGAEREESNNATSSANNNASTKQSNNQSQDGGSSGCSHGCGGNGQVQVSEESSTTTQTAESEAVAKPDVTNANLPVNLATHDPVTTNGNNSPGRDASNNAESSAGSEAQTSGTAATESSTTIQLIWQMQLSDCLARCSGTKESQTAEQQNSTVQVLNGPPQAGGAHGAEVTQNNVQAERSTTQIQLGCLSYCFGTTTTTRAPMLASYAVEELLRAIVLGVSALTATPAAEQSTVEQTSYQSQRDPRGVPVQDQSASQTSTTVQEYDPSALIAGLQKALERPAAARAQAVNQTEQGIWQLQIGCLMLCNETELSQRAAQANSTNQHVETPHAASTAAPSLASSATQLIWQAQIGCLFWCFDATEQQTATTQNTPTVRKGDGRLAPSPTEPLARPPSEAPPPSPGPTFQLDLTDELAYAATLLREMLGPEAAGVPTGAEHPRPAPAAASPGSSGADISLTSSGTATALPPSPAPALLDSSIPTVSPTADRAPRRLPASRPHRREARATYGLAPRRANVQLAVVPPRADVPRSTAEVAAVERAPAAAGTGLSDTALGSGANATSDVPLATLLSAFALCGLCVFLIAVAAARRDPRASKPGVGG